MKDVFKWRRPSHVCVKSKEMSGGRPSVFMEEVHQAGEFEGAWGSVKLAPDAVGVPELRPEPCSSDSCLVVSDIWRRKERKWGPAFLNVPSEIEVIVKLKSLACMIEMTSLDFLLRRTVLEWHW